MVRIELHKVKAEINGYVWTCTNAFMKRTLDFHTEWFLKLNDMQPSMGDPDYRVAEYIVENLGGKILKHEYTDFDPEVIY